jgi:hypothetical protein
MFAHMVTTTSSHTIEAIELMNLLSLVERMIKPHYSMLINLFYNVMRLVLTTY